MENLLSLLLGVSLSAAVGFRIFVPFLVMSLAASSGNLELAPSFAWIGTPTALFMFSAATLIEVAAYYIPWVDELLDIIATPIAVIAGVITTYSVTGEMSPLLHWTASILAGGTAAGLVQGMTDAARLTSTATTGGLGNPLLSTMELLSSVVLSVLAIALPILTGILVIGILFYAISLILKLMRRRPDLG
ncbi:DUF4126 domain-containing protein [Leptolyngbya sp. AN02str]|uniref:DUF4126 domain-containing protein n=1 Tax=Leptolyngbya sp. AN02str TaxID=3423363 RepID=UPI003D30FC9D